MPETGPVEPFSRRSGTEAPDPQEADPLRSEIMLKVVRTVDRWYVQVQNLARSVGLLGSGREAIEEVDEDALRYAVFPDLADEGWPGFRMVIPPGATLSHTTASVFYRGAHYRSEVPPEELLVRYKATLADAGLRYQSRDDLREDFLRTADLGGDVRIRIARARRGRTAVSIGQYRDHSNVEAAINEAVSRMSEQDDDPSDSVHP